MIGNDVTITFAAEAWQLQPSAFEPTTVYSLFRSIVHLEAACRTLETRCIRGITANRDRLRQSVENSIGLVTALNPYIGNASTTRVALEALEAHHRGCGVYELVLEIGLMTEPQLRQLLHPQMLTVPRRRTYLSLQASEPARIDARCPAASADALTPAF